MTRDMANLQWMRSEGACPWRANPPGDDGNGTGDERASTTADAVAVRVKGCDANGFRSTRTSRAAALKIDGYLGMSPATPAGMSGEWAVRRGRVPGGEQVDGRQQGIAFDGTVQQEGLAGLAVAQVAGRRGRDALLCGFHRLGTDDGIGRSLSRQPCMAGVRSG